MPLDGTNRPRLIAGLRYVGGCDLPTLVVYIRDSAMPLISVALCIKVALIAVKMYRP